MSQIATWVQAVGSAGSLLGFAAYVWIMLLNRRDSDEVKREEQAQKVAAWLDAGSRHDSEAEYVVCVHNGGAAPVFKCQSVVTVPGDESDERANYLHVVPPGVTAVHPFPIDVGELDEDSLYSSAAVPALEFTDSYGAHWKRDDEGVLVRLDRRKARRRPGVRRQSEGSRAGNRTLWERSA
ncbi:MAG: hypothetical protein GEU98_19745 [Pseudonocardiaceae bacterium]|nr:hypothetical protein [Pseudonocardiaceae bacterium]